MGRAFFVNDFSHYQFQSSVFELLPISLIRASALFVVHLCFFFVLFLLIAFAPLSLTTFFLCCVLWHRSQVYAYHYHLLPVTLVASTAIAFASIGYTIVKLAFFDSTNNSGGTPLPSWCAFSFLSLIGKWAHKLQKKYCELCVFIGEILIVYSTVISIVEYVLYLVMLQPVRYGV